jgi:uncharacterized membrane protein
MNMHKHMRWDVRRAFFAVAAALALGSALTQAGPTLDVPGDFKIQGAINDFIQQRLEASREAQRQRESDSRERWQQLNKRHEQRMTELQQDEEQAQNQREVRRIQQQQLALQYQPIKAELAADCGVDYTSYTPVQLEQFRQEYRSLQQNRPISKTAADGFVYVGDASVGTAFFTHGNIYSGHWDNRKQTGQGMYWWESGDFFVGEWNNGERVSGTYVFSNGELQQGKFADTRLEGPGCKVWEDGTIDLGHFKRGQRNGLVVHKYPDGNEVIGNFAFDSPTQDHVYIRDGRAVKPSNYTVDGSKITFNYDFGDSKWTTSWGSNPIPAATPEPITEATPVIPKIPQIVFTNKTKSAVTLVIAYLDSQLNSWVSEGYWTIKPGNKKTVKVPTNNDHYYYSAWSDDHSIGWSGSTHLWIAEHNAFTIRDADSTHPSFTRDSEALNHDSSARMKKHGFKSVPVRQDRNLTEG